MRSCSFHSWCERVNERVSMRRSISHVLVSISYLRSNTADKVVPLLLGLLVGDEQHTIGQARIVLHHSPAKVALEVVVVQDLEVEIDELVADLVRQCGAELVQQAARRVAVVLGLVVVRETDAQQRTAAAVAHRITEARHLSQPRDARQREVHVAREIAGRQRALEELAHARERLQYQRLHRRGNRIEHMRRISATMVRAEAAHAPTCQSMNAHMHTHTNTHASSSTMVHVPGLAPGELVAAIAATTESRAVHDKVMALVLAGLEAIDANRAIATTNSQ